MSTCFMTADPPVFHDLITWTVILVCQLGCTRQQGRRRSKYFESGSRLIGIIDALISPHSIAGILFCGLAFLALLFIFIRALAWGDPVAGWPSMVCIILLVGGVQLFSIGVLGQYLSKTYLETKRRPIYIAKEKN